MIYLNAESPLLPNDGTIRIRSDNFLLLKYETNRQKYTHGEMSGFGEVFPCEGAQPFSNTFQQGQFLEAVFLVRVDD